MKNSVYLFLLLSLGLFSANAVPTFLPDLPFQPYFLLLILQSGVLIIHSFKNLRKKKNRLYHQALEKVPLDSRSSF